MSRYRQLSSLFRTHPTMVIGGLILFVAFSAALLAPWLGTVDPLQIEPMKRLRPPSVSNWFGTDIFGRDV